MTSENPVVVMAENALAWAAQHPVSGSEDLLNSAIIRLGTVPTPLPWLVPEAVALLQKIGNLLSVPIDAETGVANDYGKRRFKVYPEGRTGTVSIGSVNQDGFITDYLGKRLYKIHCSALFDMDGRFFGVIQARGENAVVTDMHDESYHKLLLVSADLP
ncbi:hypothetical protein [Pseudomonas syringae]|uniref:hypothetical protein n=1 Tax=Pseudomonas syringae TaxID=317 RepID=UPI001F45DF18|nr:hypothetical protein [Pseudomonas syringae]MCF9000519.1 hypothetical protein [Pseudomonas syringae]